MGSVAHYVHVQASAQECYRWWRPLTHLPEIMSDVVEVSPHDTEADVTDWTVRGPAGKQLSWQARIVEDVPGQKVAWTTIDSSNPAVPNSGVVRFDNKGDGSTGVELSLTYDTPGGALGEAAATLFDNPQRKVETAVDAFRQTMEHATG